MMNPRGMTFVELLVTLVISSVIMAGVYKVVINQAKVYSAQEQVVEFQQNIRAAMDQMVSDIWMAGYDNDSSTSKIVIDHPVTPGSTQLSISYEYDDTTEYAVTYKLSGDELVKQITVIKDTGVSNTVEEVLLDGVDSLGLSYGLDTNNDGVVDSWVSASGVTSKVIAIRVQLSAHPLHPDLKGFSSRGLESVVTLRNRIL
jgi:type IV pilus assembly protein PilW